MSEMRKGNPEIYKFVKQRTGPTSEDGKLKVSLSRIKYRLKEKNSIGRRDTKKKPSMLTRMMKEAGIDFNKATEAIKLRNMFEIWYKGLSGKEITEIRRLENTIQILETDATMRTMRKLQKGIPLNDLDIKLIRLLKECLESSHKMKFGEKRVNVNADIKDIRELMMEEQK
ncbi:MAG: hypothetical protein ACTSX6_04725 [Candidatus Heimdallarchaeaceae archaeon]